MLGEMFHIQSPSSAVKNYAFKTLTLQLDDIALGDSCIQKPEDSIRLKRLSLMKSECRDETKHVLYV